MSKKKAAGKVRQKGNRSGKRLGTKVSNGEHVINGMILMRQRGSVFNAGVGVNMGRDHTLYAIKEGSVVFSKKSGDSYISVK